MTCLEAVSRALDSDPETVVVLAATPEPATYDGNARWDFGGFGLPREQGPARTRLPWSLGIGAWLLDECGWTGSRQYVGVAGVDDDGRRAEPTPPSPGTERCVVIAVADGSACRTVRAPGHLDPRAEGFDDAIADALSRGELDRLTALEPSLAQELLCGGLPAWQWLRAAVGDASVARAELLTHVAPYGVAYFVAIWWF
jgi:hypothetical protein